MEPANDQIAEILARLPTAGSGDYVTKVLEIYERIAAIYPVAERVSTVHAPPPPSVNGLASSTNV